MNEALAHWGEGYQGDAAIGQAYVRAIHAWQQ